MMTPQPHHLRSQGKRPKRSYRLKEQIQANNLELSREVLRMRRVLKESLG